MALICKLLGHKPRKVADRIISVPTGWVQEWNSVYDYIEHSKVCEDCGVRYDYVVVSYEKKKTNGNQ